MEEEVKTDNSFYFKWWPFFMGCIFHLFTVMFYMLFASEERKDKIYSSLLGLAVNLVFSFLAFRMGWLELPALPK